MGAKIDAVVFVGGCVIAGMVLKGRIDRRKEHRAAAEEGGPGAARLSSENVQAAPPGADGAQHRRLRAPDAQPAREALAVGAGRETGLSVAQDGSFSPDAPEAPTARPSLPHQAGMPAGDDRQTPLEGLVGGPVDIVTVPHQQRPAFAPVERLLQA